MKKNFSDEKIQMRQNKLIKKKISKKKPCIKNKKKKTLSTESLSLKNFNDIDSLSYKSYSLNNDYLYILNHDDSYNSLLLKQDFENCLNIN